MVCKDQIVKNEGLGDSDHVFVLGGDGPLIRAETLKTLVATHTEKKAAVTLATSILDNPAGYGRIVRDGSGNVLGIVEHNDATPEQKGIREVNPTYWLFRNADLFAALDHVQPNNKKGEYYLTDTLSILRGMNKTLAAVAAKFRPRMCSRSTRGPRLADVAKVVQKRIRKNNGRGVTLVSPEKTWIEYGAEIGAESVLEPFCFIGAGKKVAAGAHLKAGTVL